MNDDNLVLAIDEDFSPKITLDEGKALTSIQKSFIDSYVSNKDKLSTEEWLKTEMSKNLPNRSDKEISEITNGIIDTVKLQNEKRESLNKAISDGRSKESWFASEVKKATSAMSAQEASKYLQSLDDALENSNDALLRTIHTKIGVVNQNPQLDGFIAEQYHAQTFNLNAEAAGSEYRAKVLEPDGTAYGKNSVDIVITDRNGKIVKRYQSKYCKDAESTLKAFEHGDYRGQRKLVPEGQEQDISKKVTTTLEAPDGTKSTPLSKEQAKELQKNAQSGKWSDLDWNEYKVKDIAIGIAKQAGQAAILGAAISTGVDVVQKIWHGEEIEGEEVVEKAIISGADFGIKAATAGALKVGVEKGLIKVIPKGTPVGRIANIAHIAIENIKVLGKVATSELTLQEGAELMGRTTVSAVAGVMASTKATALGASIGMAFGPVGSAVGSFVGGTVGYIAGSKIGSAVVTGIKTVGTAIKNGVKALGNKIKEGASKVVNKLCQIFS